MRKLFFTIAVLLLLAVIAAPPAMAVGTVAGTTISNQAYADYKDANGNAMAQVKSNIITITISQVAGVFIDPPTASQAASNGQVIRYLVQLFNTGNGPDTQTFSYASTGAWSPVAGSVKMYYDVNNNHIYDAGDILLSETAAGSQTYITTVSIVPDDDYDVILEFTVPTGLTNNTSNVITINTHSNFDPTKTASSVLTTTVEAAVISAVKTHTPAGTPTYVKPGDIITYQVRMDNTGSGAGSTATALTATDVIPTSLTFVPGSIRVNDGTGWQTRPDACTTTEACYDAATHSIKIPGNGTSPSPYSLASGGYYIVEIQARVNEGVPSGSAITNQATIGYTSGTFTTSVQTNADTCLVSTTTAIDLSTTTANKTGNPSDQIVYPFTATNNSNADDKIDLTVNSSNGWTWAIYFDADNSGTLTAGDTLLTDTSTPANGKIDTNTLNMNGGSVNLLAVTTIPAGKINGTTDTLTITGYSGTDPTKTDMLTWTTTVIAPLLTIAKVLVNVAQPAGITPASCVPTNQTTGADCNYYPGSILTYQVTATNTGNGNATGVTIGDTAPPNTTYVAGSIKTGDSVANLQSRTDAADADGARYQGGAIIAGDSGSLTLGPLATWVLEFKVTIN